MAEGSGAEGGEADAEMAAWLVRTLQKVQPGAELTEGSSERPQQQSARMLPGAPLQEPS